MSYQEHDLQWQNWSHKTQDISDKGGGHETEESAAWEAVHRPVRLEDV